MSRFKKAIDAGDVELVRKLLDDDSALASSPISWGPMFRKCETEPLHYLCDAPFNGLWDHGKQPELALALIKAGAPVDGLPTSGETPLHGAASLGEPEVAKVLLANGANIEAIAKYPGIPDGTPLDFAVHFGMVEVVDLLVERGADVKSTRMAAGAGQHERVKRELDSPQPEAAHLTDVFRCAVVCNRVEVVKILLSNWIDVNADINGATALHWAAWEAKLQMVSFLLENGAHANVADRKHKLTPHGWASHRRREVGPRWRHEEVMRVLESA